MSRRLNHLQPINPIYSGEEGMKKEFDTIDLAMRILELPSIRDYRSAQQLHHELTEYKLGKRKGFEYIKIKEANEK